MCVIIGDLARTTAGPLVRLVSAVVLAVAPCYQRLTDAVRHALVLVVRTLARWKKHNQVITGLQYSLSEHWPAGRNTTKLSQAYSTRCPNTGPLEETQPIYHRLTVLAVRTPTRWKKHNQVITGLQYSLSEHWPAGRNTTNLSQAYSTRCPNTDPLEETQPSYHRLTVLVVRTLARWKKHNQFITGLQYSLYEHWPTGRNTTKLSQAYSTRCPNTGPLEETQPSYHRLTVLAVRTLARWMKHNQFITGLQYSLSEHWPAGRNATKLSQAFSTRCPNTGPLDETQPSYHRLTVLAVRTLARWMKHNQVITGLQYSLSEHWPAGRNATKLSQAFSTRCPNTGPLDETQPSYHWLTVLAVRTLARWMKHNQVITGLQYSLYEHWPAG